jgi:hypothetical protein
MQKNDQFMLPNIYFCRNNPQHPLYRTVSRPPSKYGVIQKRISCPYWESNLTHRSSSPQLNHCTNSAIHWSYRIATRFSTSLWNRNILMAKFISRTLNIWMKQWQFIQKNIYNKTDEQTIIWGRVSKQVTNGSKTAGMDTKKFPMCITT